MSKRTTATTLIVISLMSIFTGAIYAADSGTVTLNAEASGYTLTVNIIGLGNVTLNDLGPYALGDVVTLTQTPAENWRFTGWTGDATGTETTVNVTMDSDKTVTANFTLNIISIDVTPSSIDFGTVHLGTESAGHAVDISNTGNVRVWWTVSVNETTPFFETYLKLNAPRIPITDVTGGGLFVGMTSTNTFYLDLTSAPDSAAASHDGTLIFWAEAI